MKRTFLESLVDYDLAMLEAVAEVRGAELSTSHQLEAARQLARALLAPASLAFALDELSTREQEALSALATSGGWMESHRFARRFGEIVPVGPGRLLRDKTWTAPSSPAEGLWYRALIFKGFRQTESALTEVVYVPDDLLALLPGTDLLSEDATMGALDPVAPPPTVSPAGFTLVEDVFVLLTSVRNRRVRSTGPTGLGGPDRRAVETQMPPDPNDAGGSLSGRLDLALHLARSTGLVQESKGQWTLSADRAREWLSASQEYAAAGLASLWWHDGEWNDLQHVPGLALRPTGWTNDPLLARSALGGVLARCQPGVWYRLDELLALLKHEAPDFQRPDGDFSTWYIENTAGEPLMGFEHWGAVEGALITYLLSGPLHRLGIADIGYEAVESQTPLAFRLTYRLENLDTPYMPAPEMSPGHATAPVDTPLSQAGGDFALRFDRAASLLDRFLLARMADLTGWEQGAVLYEVSVESLARARRQGATAEQITAFLRRVGGEGVSQTLLDAVYRWQMPGTAAHLEKTTLLRTESREILDHLLQTEGLRAFLGDRLGPTTAMVKDQHLQAVRSWMERHGYLDTGR